MAKPAEWRAVGANRSGPHLAHAHPPWPHRAATLSDEGNRAWFDPSCPTQPLEFFEDLVHELLAEPNAARLAR